MIKQWVTVVSWQQGKVLLRYDVQSSCSQCGVQNGCGSRLLNILGTPHHHLISLDCEQPLITGQKVELAIGENSLLGSAILVYLLPLAGLLLMAILFQTVFATDLAALAGAICGGIGGFLLARGCWQKFSQHCTWQPVIVSISLPPDVVNLHIETQTTL